MQNEVLAIIPARGGSKGIPRKNLTLLGGQPLISYSIRAALACRLISRVVVTTDDEEIASVARSFGAEVPFLRPSCMAGDRSDIGLCMQHAISFLTDRGYALDHVVQLYPTAPFRTPAWIEMMVLPLLEGYQSSIVARNFSASKRFFVPAVGGEAVPLLLDTPEDGSFLRRYGLFLGHAVRPALRGVAVHMLEDQIMAIDIDSLEDLRLAEAVITNNLFDFCLA